MENYLGVKLVKGSKEMSRKEYCDYRGWALPSDENGEDRVYLVEYEKDENSKQNHPNHEGYISMSPKDVFEKAYRPVNGLTFGLAIEALKVGKCISRKGWNGKGMFICKQVSSEINANIIPKMQSLPEAAKHILHNGIDDTRPIFYVNQMIITNEKTREINSWAASSSDTFAEDWYIVD